MFRFYLFTLLAAVNPLPAGAYSCQMQSPVAQFSESIIVDYFRAPKCEQCAGNRGLELRLKNGEPIFAVADGVVTFRGEVNKIKYLVLTTKHNRRITYGKFAASNLRLGDRVLAGQRVATSSDVLYFGIRETSGGVVGYVDPLIYVRPAMTISANGPRVVLIGNHSRQLGAQNRPYFQC